MSTSPQPTPTQPASAASGVARYSNTRFLFCLILLIVSDPFVRMMHDGRMVAVGLWSLLLLSGILTMRGRRKGMPLALSFAVPALAARWLHHYHPAALPAVVIPAISVPFLVLIVVRFLRFILRAPRVDSQVLAAGVSVYLLLGLLWGLLYMTVATLDPAAFSYGGAPGGSQFQSRFEIVYFSFVTLNTVGYGDIVPVSNVARMLAMIESTTGVLYMAVLVARLVSLHTAQGPLVDNHQESGGGQGSARP